MDTTPTTNDVLLNISELQTYFYTEEGVSKAVDGVSYYVKKRETLGVVGESGCGKSVTALSIMQLIPQPPGKIIGGDITFEGRSLLSLSSQEMRKIRGNKISMIFQEPMTSLNPVFTIGNQISEAIQLHQGLSKKDALDRSVEMLKLVGIPSPEQRVKEYPHQLSGGMRQRAMIAMALSCNPSLLIADEPTTALDVTIQAQILDLMASLKDEFDTAIILITHDLGVVAETVARVVVMYAGKIVEEADVYNIFEHPQHPYTVGLLKSIPRIDLSVTTRERLQEISGVVPIPSQLPAGCLFHPRCPHVMDVCRQELPVLKPTKNTAEGHMVRCWLYE
ncbi:ATP-binding cassette domain-containing protein [candidate division KSB3 bacterium]|uniref:ATP-binding cassette domain-containing protein n=1 Tax=candidate division KSB3 bacterium TaxID=2044937 RepID=A0A9D5JWD3_9BACT|nr:ATP-binding cassette domain-containing protein [candidate division KSB3 bacterium]MBD3325176.1 ATP-binding cassette domain-containing protein [candidate division KSB3 bacterium]